MPTESTTKSTKAKTSKCAVPLCDEPSVALGFCGACYEWKRWIELYAKYTPTELAAYIYRRRRLVSRIDYLGLGQKRLRRVA